MKPLVIYHAGCRDGFCSAWIAWNHFHEKAEYLSAHYGSAPPIVDGRDVYLLDFSFPRAVLREMALAASGLVILDHHETAKADLEGFPEEMRASGRNVICVFDVGHSGARLANLYFNQADIANPNPPSIVLYVEDRDLWRFELPNSREINSWISTLPFEFESWAAAASLLEFHSAKAVELGTVVQMKIRTYAAEVAKTARLIQFEGEIGVPCVNAAHVDLSEVLQSLMNCFGKQIAIGWFVESGGLAQVSIRTRGDLSASEMAQKYGGGGHKHAAGFRIEAKKWLEVIR